MPTIAEDTDITGNVTVRGQEQVSGLIRSLTSLLVSDQQTVATYPGLVAGFTDPSAVGRAAAIGALYMRTSSPPELWQKTGAGDTAWSIVAGGAVPLIGAPFTLTGDITPAAIGPGLVNDYAPAGLASATRIRQAVNVAGATLTGIVAQPAGRVLALINLGPSTIQLSHEGASTNVNRFNLPNAEDAFLPPLCACVFIYDGTLSRWTMFAEATIRDVSRDLDTLHVHDQQGGAAVADLTMTAGDPNGIISAPAGSLCLDDTTPGVWMNTDGATAWVQLATNVTAVDGIGWFGDGSDGTVTWDGVSNVLGLAPVAGVYTLTRDVMVRNSTISAGARVDTAGFRYFDNGTCTINGTGRISRNGNNGGAAAGVSAGAAGAACRGTNVLLADGIAGAIGGGAGPAQATAARRLTGGAGVAGGGNGGAGTPGSNGAPGGVGQGGGGGGGGGTNSGTGGSAAGGTGGANTLVAANQGGDTADIMTGINGGTMRQPSTKIGAGAGGAGGGAGGLGGGGGTQGAGGGGGSAGGYTVVCCRRFAGTASPAIESIGGNGGLGGNAAGGVNGGGGGGAGGPGGVAVVVTTTSATDWPDSQVSVAGGTGANGGTPTGGGGAGGRGGDGGLGLKNIFRVGA